MATKRNIRPPRLKASASARAGRWIGLLLGFSLWSAAADPLPSPLLQFIQPTNSAVFSSFDEIPVVVRAIIPEDVILTADIVANNVQVATTSFCCALCPCAFPQEGKETILQIPASWVDGHPPPHPWQDWTDVPIRTYRLIAQATSQKGSVVSSLPIIISVIDRSLHMFLREDGAASFVIPQGSMVGGEYDLEASQDLRTWTRLGPFEPGNVAAFYLDPPDPTRSQRFYRSVYTPANFP